jgi:predicted SAM-dependent methyltransferase
VKLQVGSSVARGGYKEKDWVNLDLSKVKGVNVQGDACALPFASNSFEEIHCIHMLEHLTRDLQEPVLREMNRVLAPNGKCWIEVPDFQETIKRVQSGFDRQDMERIRVWTVSVYGKSERPGMAHHWGFHERDLKRKMLDAGFFPVIRKLNRSQMISNHHLMEPVLLMVGEK